jgi:hypothetical protein
LYVRYWHLADATEEQKRTIDGGQAAELIGMR